MLMAFRIISTDHTHVVVCKTGLWAFPGDGLSFLFSTLQWGRGGVPTTPRPYTHVGLSRTESPGLNVSGLRKWLDVTSVVCLEVTGASTEKAEAPRDVVTAWPVV